MDAFNGRAGGQEVAGGVFQVRDIPSETQNRLPVVNWAINVWESRVAPSSCLVNWTRDGHPNSVVRENRGYGNIIRITATSGFKQEEIRQAAIGVGKVYTAKQHGLGPGTIAGGYSVKVKVVHIGNAASTWAAD